MEIIKSPIFYMGNKYDLLQNLLTYFPKKENVKQFVDLFGGSGVVSLNVPYDNIIYNEINHNITNLFKMLIETEPSKTIEHISKRIEEFELYNKTTDTRQVDDINIRKLANIKYLKFRKFYNSQKKKDYLDLYTLTYFSFCNLIRFNSKSEFNMPYGNGCFLYGEHDINIELFYNVMKTKSVEIINSDAFELLGKIKQNEQQFIYLDPPYANTMAIYNESRAFGGWNLDHDEKLFNELDRLNNLGIKWAMSNVLENKGIKNIHIEEWATKNNYKIIDFENKQYSALGKGNAKSREVLIVNYEPPFEQYNIFDLLGE